MADGADIHTQSAGILCRHSQLQNSIALWTTDDTILFYPPVTRSSANQAVVVGNRFLQPETMIFADSVLAVAGEQGGFHAALAVTVDNRIVSCAFHGLHRLSVQVKETAFAVGKCFIIDGEEHGGETEAHSPDASVLVLGYSHRLSLTILQEQFALVSLVGETGSVLLTEFRLAAEEEFESHIVHTPLLILVFTQLG